jgi:hypothetical protein
VEALCEDILVVTSRADRVNIRGISVQTEGRTYAKVLRQVCNYYKRKGDRKSGQRMRSRDYVNLCFVIKHSEFMLSEMKNHWHIYSEGES